MGEVKICIHSSEITGVEAICERLDAPNCLCRHQYIIAITGRGAEERIRFMHGLRRFRLNISADLYDRSRAQTKWL